MTTASGTNFGITVPGSDGRQLPLGVVITLNLLDGLQAQCIIEGTMLLNVTIVLTGESLFH